MKLNKFLLVTALSLFAASGLMAKTQAKEEVPGVAAQLASYFYTGKPYDADLEAYTFKSRNYDPALARWTSADPSGFPDGANDRIYAPVPTMNLDPNGEATTYLRTQVYELTGYYEWWTSRSSSATFTFTLGISPSITGSLSSQVNVIGERSNMTIATVSDNGMPTGTQWREDPGVPRSKVNDTTSKMLNTSNAEQYNQVRRTTEYYSRWDVSGGFTITTGYYE